MNSEVIIDVVSPATRLFMLFFLFLKELSYLMMNLTLSVKIKYIKPIHSIETGVTSVNATIVFCMWEFILFQIVQRQMMKIEFICLFQREGKARGTKFKFTFSYTKL